MGNPGIGSATYFRGLPDSRRGWGRAAWVGLVVLGLTFARAGWAQRSYDDLDDAVRDLTRTLVERGELVALFSAADLAGKRVLVKSDDFFETETGFRLPLSKVLSRKCATELTRSRVPVALEGTDEDAVRVLHGRWKPVPGGRLDLTLFVAEPVKGRGEPVALVSVEGRVPVEGIRPEDIEPTLEHWGRYLVRRLDRGVRDQGRRTVRIQPLSVPDEGVARPDELGRVLEGWLAEALLESRWFEFVEPAPSGSGAAVKVDGELLGSGTVSDEHVKVSVRVLDNHRRRVTVASVELSKALFDETLFGAGVTGGGEEDGGVPELEGRLATAEEEEHRGAEERRNAKLKSEMADIKAGLTPVNKIMVATQSAVLRQEPDLTAKLMAVIESGQRIEVLARMEGWWQVRDGLNLAYVQADLLRDLQCRTVTQERVVKRETLKIDSQTRDKYWRYAKIGECRRNAHEDFRHSWKGNRASCENGGGQLESKFSWPSMKERRHSTKYYCWLTDYVDCVHYRNTTEEICE